MRFFELPPLRQFGSLSLVQLVDNDRRFWMSGVGTLAILLVLPAVFCPSNWVNAFHNGRF